MECQVCGKVGPKTMLCPECGALSYCSTRHMEMHRNVMGHDPAECARMRAQMSRQAVRTSYCIVHIIVKLNFNMQIQ